MAVQLLDRIHDWLYRSRRKLATAGVAALALMLAFHVVFGANGMLAFHQKRAEYRSLEKDIQQLQQDNERLSKQIQSLKSDPATIEREAREKLRYARPGEVVFTLPEERPAPATPATAQKR